MRRVREDRAMKFNVWLVIALALMPAFVLFAGMSAADAYRSHVEWDVMAALAAAALLAAWLSSR
jgi:uncharacterized membrane protein